MFVHTNELVCRHVSCVCTAARIMRHGGRSGFQVQNAQFNSYIQTHTHTHTHTKVGFKLPCEMSVVYVFELNLAKQ